MCTLAFAWREFDDAPLVVAANRDEAVGRPSTPPAVRGQHPRVLMPRDEEAGGTWIGVNEHRLFVGVTNRPADVEGERSRGLLVTDALGAESAIDALQRVERELAERDYAGFNLLLADDEDCVLLEWDGVLRTHHLDPGTHAVVNRGFDDATEKSRTVRAALSNEESPTAWHDAARTTMRDHDADVCIHRDGYGTRSSSLLWISAGGEVDYEFADGPPCENDYRRINGHL
ncbi:NRDE family protein [Halobacterium wangiae]|uniref:NRDE family protein n=1 Tax=Halobacterium wangiae TaxID=2902623 RepID=UPI001E3D4C5F|nr:NRDE family protein [Halobacterium wangiae]